MAAIDVNVTVRGPLFRRKIDEVVKRSIIEEVLLKVEERVERQGKGLASRINFVDAKIKDLELTEHSTLRYPRTTGAAKQRRDVRAVKALAPRVMQRAAERIVERLSEQI